MFWHTTPIVGSVIQHKHVQICYSSRPLSCKYLVRKYEFSRDVLLNCQASYSIHGLLPPKVNVVLYVWVDVKKMHTGTTYMYLFQVFTMNSNLQSHLSVTAAAKSFGRWKFRIWLRSKNVLIETVNTSVSTQDTAHDHKRTSHNRQAYGWDTNLHKGQMSQKTVIMTRAIYIERPTFEPL